MKFDTKSGVWFYGIMPVNMSTSKMKFDAKKFLATELMSYADDTKELDVWGCAGHGLLLEKHQNRAILLNKKENGVTLS